MRRVPIGSFIEKFKFKYAKELIEVFSEGNCYHFAVILKDLYPEGNILYDNIAGHFIYQLQGSYWDITGDVTSVHIDKDGSIVDWEMYHMKEPIQANNILLNCGYKVYKED